MSDNQDQPSRGAEPVPEPVPEPVDPWAPPERKVPLEKPVSDRVHDQPTVTSMPGAGAAGPGPVPGPSGAGFTDVGPSGWEGAVPPPPTAPGGPGQAVPGSYGYPAYPYPNYPGYGYGHAGWTGMGAPLNGFGTTALVLGIVSVVLFCLWGLGIILGILALVFGFLGRGRARRGEATNGGQALAGIILGAVGIVVSGVILGLMVWAVTHDDGDDGSSSVDDPFATTLVVERG
ncbi:DUF4190 domain-containing protein [Streptomyces sp. NPDC023838]|uniref:DUF4190 domain-containing protein n=1 Tax=Streptomyces sp. NPDC023838 TaxID=3154325 RepID=UPI0033CE5C5A